MVILYIILFVITLVTLLGFLAEADRSHGQRKLAMGLLALAAAMLAASFLREIMALLR